MLIDFIINGIDTFIIMYLWTIIMRNNNIFKLIGSIVILSISVTVIEALGLNFIFTYLIDIIIIKIIYNNNFKKVILGFILALVTDISLGLIISIFVNKLSCHSSYRAIVAEVLILIVIIAINKTKWFKKNITFEILDNNAVVYLILICFSYAAVFKVIWNHNDKIILNNLLSISIIFCTLVISQILTYLYLLKLIKEKETLKISNEYNEVIDEIVQEIKQRQHDFVNYKNTIKGIIAVTDESHIKTVIGDYIKEEDVYDDKINDLIYIDNVVVKSIIYRSIDKAKKNNVNFEFKIENNVLDSILSYHEMANLLNNLLNNSFDEVLKEECDRKNIQIKLFKLKKTSHLIIKNQIVNLNDINLNEMFTRGYSTKKSSNIRGYGLYNVQKIVELHKGYVKLNVENEEITFNVYFNNSSG